MLQLPKLLQLTPEGRIIAALAEAPKSYTEMHLETKLSDRWLSKKLRELLNANLIQQTGGKYQLKIPNRILDADPVFAEYLRTKSSLIMKARLIGEELSHLEGVLAVVLFGSTAKGTSAPESDIDLLIVTERELEDQLNRPLYDLMFRYDAPVEGLFLTYEELLMSLHEMNALALGVLEAYQILQDKIGLEGLFSLKKRQMQEEWNYDEETETWIRKSLMPTLKPRRNKRETQS